MAGGRAAPDDHRPGPDLLEAEPRLLHEHMKTHQDDGPRAGQQCDGHQFGADHERARAPADPDILGEISQQGAHAYFRSGGARIATHALPSASTCAPGQMRWTPPVQSARPKASG